MNKLLTSETSDDQLRALATKLGLKLDYIVFKSDLKKLPVGKTGYNKCNIVIHLENPAHWTALYIDKPKAYYFNSFDDKFGDVPVEVTDFIKRNKCYLVKIDDFPIQSPYRGFCGQYCVLWLYYMNRPTDDAFDFNSYLKLFKNSNNIINVFLSKNTN